MKFLRLLKLELKCSWRSFAVIYGLVIVLALMTGLSDSKMAFAFPLFGLGYGMVIMAACILCLIAIIRNYHVSMFSRASYLTHTLPVSSVKLFLAKMTGSAFWTVLTVCVMYVSVVILGVSSRVLSLEQLFGAVGEWDLSWFVPAALYMFVSLIGFIAVCYFVMNLVHTPLVRAHRNGIAVILFLLLAIARGWIDGKIFVSSGESYAVISARSAFASFTGYSQPAWMVIGWEFLWAVLFSAAGIWLLKHQLEVE